MCICTQRERAQWVLEFGSCQSYFFFVIVISLSVMIFAKFVIIVAVCFREDEIKIANNRNVEWKISWKSENETNNWKPNVRSFRLSLFNGRCENGTGMWFDRIENILAAIIRWLKKCLNYYFYFPRSAWYSVFSQLFSIVEWNYRLESNESMPPQITKWMSSSVRYVKYHVIFIHHFEISFKFLTGISSAIQFGIFPKTFNLISFDN